MTEAAIASWIDDYPFIRQVSSPLTRRMLRPLDPRCRTVQFNSALTEKDFKRLAKFLRRYPGVGLRAYGSYKGSIRDVDFLRHFPDLRRFSVDAIYELDNIEGLANLRPDLVSLGIGRTRKAMSLKPLARFESLRVLSLEGQSKDIEVVGELTALRSLTLRSITLPNLQLLARLGDLRILDLKLGGIRNLDGIEALSRLGYLELWLIRGFDNLAPIIGVPSLEVLFLQALTNVRSLPDLSRMPHLKRIYFETMKGLSDLRPLLAAPSLEGIALVDMPHLAPEQVGVLAQHPNLTSASAGLGSKRKNDAASALLGLPRFEFDLQAYLAGLIEN